MGTLYLYNIGSYIYIEFEGLHIQYLGAKNLVDFVKVNKFSGGVIYVDTKFSDCIEEDYIDLEDIFSDYDYNASELIEQIKEIKIGKNKEMKKTKKQVKTSNTVSKMDLINNSLMVSDNLALIKQDSSTGFTNILVVNMTKTDCRALIRLHDTVVLQSNMSESLLKRAVDTVKRNKTLIVEELRERGINA